jgi:hypothetical protein
MNRVVHVELPASLCRLAQCESVLRVEIAEPVTPGAIVDALEARLPALRGTVRDHGTGQRRAYLRFFASGEDISHRGMDEPVSDEVAGGREPFVIIGAIAGG